MLVPLILWAITGFVFLTKPGYEGAYEQLQPKLYPINQVINIDPNGWTEAKVYRTILGEHLLVKDQGEWKHLGLSDLQEQAFPSEQNLKLLINDAISENRNRYGEILHLDGQTIYTDTGVKITLDWNTLSLRQKGPDTDLINTLYHIHYLQWLDSPTLNKALGFLGLLLLIALSGFGFVMLLKRQKD
tara:strand:+ start:731 stop:1291 length:561 start_codon:yes stop_codon:yes gene_type:complete